MSNYKYTGISAYLPREEQSLVPLSKISKFVEQFQQTIVTEMELNQWTETAVKEDTLELMENGDFVEGSQWLYGVDEAYAPANTPIDKLANIFDIKDDMYYIYIPFASKRHNQAIKNTILSILKHYEDQVIQLAVVEGHDVDDFNDLTPQVYIQQND